MKTNPLNITTMRRFVVLIIALCAFYTPIYAQRPITEEDKNVTAEIRKRHPKHSLSYDEEYGVYLLSETITPKNPKYSEYDLYSLLDSKGNELFPNCSFTKIYFRSADGLNKNYYPYIEAQLEKTMWALSFDGQWLTMPIKGNIWSMKRKNSLTQKTSIFYSLPEYPLKYSIEEGFYLGYYTYQKKKKAPKIKSALWIDINGNSTYKSPIPESNDRIIKMLEERYKIGVLYDAATHTYRVVNGALCDKDGNELVPPAKDNEYTWSKFYQGYALVHNANTKKYGIYSLKGERLIPVEHYGIDIEHDRTNTYRYFVCHTTAQKTYDDNYNATIYDMAGNMLIPPYYGSISQYHNEHGFCMEYEYNPNKSYWFKIFLDENSILDPSRSEEIDYSIPEAYFARIKANEERRIEEERLAAQRRAAAEAARIQRQQAWQQLAAAVGNLATNVNNAINQHSGSRTYSTTPTYSRPASVSNSTSAANATDIQHCKSYYRQWESKAGHWINNFTKEQAWFKANKNTTVSQLELTGHQRSRNDARAQLKNIQSMLQNYRSRAAKAGGNIPKGNIESQIDALLNQPNY